jgi:hypothetical protein
MIAVFSPMDENRRRSPTFPIYTGHCEEERPQADPNEGATFGRLP